MRTFYFTPVVSSFFFFPRLFSAVADWMSTSGQIASRRAKSVADVSAMEASQNPPRRSQRRGKPITEVKSTDEGKIKLSKPIKSDIETSSDSEPDDNCCTCLSRSYG